MKVTYENLVRFVFFIMKLQADSITVIGDQLLGEHITQYGGATIQRPAIS